MQQECTPSSKEVRVPLHSPFVRWKLEANITYLYPMDFENDKPKCNVTADRFTTEGPWFFSTQVDIMDQLRPENKDSDYTYDGKKIPFKLKDPKPKQEVRVSRASPTFARVDLRVFGAIGLASWLVLAVV